MPIPAPIRWLRPMIPALAVALAASSPASAAVTLYTDAISFVTALGGIPPAESFDSIANGTPIPAGTVIGDIRFDDFPDDTNGGLVNSEFPFFFGSPVLTVDKTTGADLFEKADDFTVTFLLPVYAVGIYFNTSTNITVSPGLFISTPEGTVTSNLAPPEPVGPHVFFVGLISDTPFTTATIGSNPIPVSYVFNTDQLFYAPYVECGDGLDNDGDGFCDAAGATCTDGSTPGDPGCNDATDLSERRSVAEGPPFLPCDDGSDNDLDGRIDFDPVTREGERLAFVTSTNRDATSSDIADYNAFVTSVAQSRPELAALGTTWTAIASTATVDARDNTGTNPAVSTGGPIRRLDDSLIASDNADLWDGSLANPLNIDETESVLNTSVWTGSGSDGTAAGAVIVCPLGNSFAVRGSSSSVSASWIDLSSCSQSDFFDYSLYAISDPLGRFTAGQGDPGCESPTFFTETPTCQDGVNNDPGAGGQPGIDFDGGQSVHGACNPTLTYTVALSGGVTSSGSIAFDSVGQLTPTTTYSFAESICTWIGGSGDFEITPFTGTWTGNALVSIDGAVQDTAAPGLCGFPLYFGSASAGGGPLDWSLRIAVDVILTGTYTITPDWTCPPGVSDPDGDGFANPDPKCNNLALPVGLKPWLKEVPTCGLGFELALLLPGLAWLRRRRA